LHLARIEAAGNTQSRPGRSLFQSIRSAAKSASRFAASSGSRFAVLTAAVAFLAGCGNTYRPVISAINPVGPAAQPQKLAVVISNPGSTEAGLLTFVDFAGDTILITASVGVNPYYLVLNSGGSTGYTLNGDGTLSSFSISTSLLTSQILQTTLLNSNGVLPTSLFPEGTFTYVTQPNSDTTFTTPPTGRNSIAEFTGTPLSLQQELSIPTTFSPIYVTGVTSAARSFVLAQSVPAGSAGAVFPIENTTTPTLDPLIPVGKGPVYGVMTADSRRAFVMNQTDGTVSVINAQTNALDTVPAGATNPIAVTSAPNSPSLPAALRNPLTANPLWADFAPTLNEMVVANAGDGVDPGFLSIISIPLCTATVVITNPNCDINNPVDAAGFGQVLANVPTGINTVMVSVLQDGSRAYVANTGDPTLPCALPPAVPGTSTVCSVSVVNLTTNTVTQTLYALPDSLCQGTPTAPTLHLCGHPAYIAATTGTPTGKVYVVSKDSTNLSVIRTDIDAVDTTVPLQGLGVSVRVTAP